jgi:PadR family transcriptional regulator, regulatory protein PadR
MSEPVDREIRLALWKLHILHHATQRPVYGLWLLEELAEHGHRLSPGTLYPILERMERNGWLRSEATERANARKNYRITAAGRRLLDELRADVDELHREVVLGIEPKHASVARGTAARSTHAPRTVARAKKRSVAGGRGS